MREFVNTQKTNEVFTWVSCSNVLRMTSSFSRGENVVFNCCKVSTASVNNCSLDGEKGGFGPLLEFIVFDGSAG